LQIVIVLDPSVDQIKAFAKSQNIAKQHKRVYICLDQKTYVRLQDHNVSPIVTIFDSGRSSDHIEYSSHQRILDKFSRYYLNYREVNNRKAAIVNPSLHAFVLSEFFAYSRIAHELLEKIICIVSKELHATSAAEYIILHRDFINSSLLNNGVHSCIPLEFLVAVLEKELSVNVKRYKRGILDKRKDLAIGLFRLVKSCIFELYSILFALFRTVTSVKSFNSVYVGTGIPLDRVSPRSVVIEFGETCVGSPNAPSVIRLRFFSSFVGTQHLVSNVGLELFHSFFRDFRYYMSHASKELGFSEDYGNICVISKQVPKLTELFFEIDKKSFIGFTHSLIRSILMTSTSIHICDQLSIQTINLLGSVDRGLLNSSIFVISHSEGRNDYTLLRMFPELFFETDPPKCIATNYSQELSCVINHLNAFDDSRFSEVKVVLYASYKWHRWKYDPSLFSSWLRTIIYEAFRFDLRVSICRKKGAEDCTSLADYAIEPDELVGRGNLVYRPFKVIDGKFPCVFAICHFGLAHSEFIRKGHCVVIINPDLGSIPSNLSRFPISESLELSVFQSGASCPAKIIRFLLRLKACLAEAPDMFLIYN